MKNVTSICLGTDIVAMTKHVTSVNSEQRQTLNTESVTSARLTELASIPVGSAQHQSKNEEFASHGKRKRCFEPDNDKRVHHEDAVREHRGIQNATLELCMERLNKLYKKQNLPILHSELNPLAPDLCQSTRPAAVEDSGGQEYHTLFELTSLQALQIGCLENGQSALCLAIGSLITTIGIQKSEINKLNVRVRSMQSAAVTGHVEDKSEVQH